MDYLLFRDRKSCAEELKHFNIKFILNFEKSLDWVCWFGLFLSSWATLFWSHFVYSSTQHRDLIIEGCTMFVDICVKSQLCDWISMVRVKLAGHGRQEGGRPGNDAM